MPTQQTDTLRILPVGQPSNRESDPDKDQRFLNCFIETVPNPFSQTKKQWLVKRDGFTQYERVVYDELDFSLGTPLVSGFVDNTSEVFEPELTQIGDPYWNYVVLLLHFDGAGTDFIDSKGRHTMSVAGSVVESTAQQKFGSRSGKFEDTYDNIYCNDNINDFKFLSGDAFAIEFFIYRYDASDTSRLFHILDSGGVGTAYLQLICLTTGALELERFGAYISTPSGVITTNTWHHVAVTRDSSNVVRIFVDGDEKASVTWAVDLLGPSVDTFLIGNGTGSSRVFSYIDEFRVTNGIARYTTNFTPPTLPFPNY